MQRVSLPELGSNGPINNDAKRRKEQERIDREKEAFFANKGKIEIIDEGEGCKTNIPFAINEKSAQVMADRKVRERQTKNSQTR